MKSNQKGIAPILLIILLTIVIVGGGATYFSQKQINLKNTPKSNNKPEVFQETKKGGMTVAPKAELAKESVNYGTKGTKAEGLPNINIFPPAGWKQLPPEGSDVIIFESPEKDYTVSGDSKSWTIARVKVNITKASMNNLEEAVKKYKAENESAVPTVYTVEQKTVFAGGESYYLEADHDLRDATRPQFEEEVRKSGKKVSQQQLTELMRAFQTRSATYFLQKNGYDVAVSGVSSASFWDKRGPEIKKSIGSLVFVGR